MNVAHVGRYVRSPQVAAWKKALGVFAVLYAVLPFDLIPDWLPLVGWLDDVGVLALAFTLLAKDMARHATRVPQAPSRAIIDVVPSRR